MNEDDTSNTGEISMAGEKLSVVKNGVSQQVRPMSESRRKRVETGLLAVQEAEHEAFEFKRLLDDETLKLRALQAEHEALRAAYSRQQTEIESYRRERDNAVAKRAEVEALFDAVRTLMNNRRTETVIEETDAGDGDAGGDAQSS